MNINLQDTWVRRNAKLCDSVIARWFVTFYYYFILQLFGSRLYACKHIEVLLEVLQGRHKQVYLSFAHFNAKSCLDNIDIEKCLWFLYVFRFFPFFIRLFFVLIFFDVNTIKFIWNIRSGDRSLISLLNNLMKLRQLR